MVNIRNRVYFGTKERMTWLRAPDTNYDGSRVGWDGNVTQFLNGGASVRRSTLAHRTYNLSWNMMSRDEIRAIMDYADGVYGDGAIYFLDPFAMDKNLLPQHWAVPSLALADPYLLVGGSGYLQSGAGVGESSYGFPTRPVVIEGDGSGPSLYIPIPPGHTAWFGMYGIAQGGGPVLVSPTGGNDVVPSVLPVTTVKPFSNSWNGDLYSGITLSMDSSSNLGQRSTLVAMMLQIHPNSVNGQKAAPFRFISGQGHSGLHFTGQPSLTQYSKALDKVSLAATLIEDEAWR